jgi:hypothetical protein
MYVIEGFCHLHPFYSSYEMHCRRRSQMLENERMQVKELKNRGYSPRQLQEMGYSESALHTPALALAKPY